MIDNIIYFLLGVIYSTIFASILLEDKTVLTKQQHKYECRRNIGIGYITHKRGLNLDKVKDNWCRQ